MILGRLRIGVDPPIREGMSENLGSVGGAVAVPRPLLSAAVFCVAVSAVLVVPSVFVLHAVGYVLSSFVTIGLVALYRRIDLERRGRVGYVAAPRLAVVANSLAAIGVIVAAIHVWWIATELAG